MRNRVRWAGLSLSVAFATAWVGSVRAEPAACTSAQPPAPSKPYFLFIVDSSGSMNDAMTPAPSCQIANGYSSNYPSKKTGHARCALYNTINAFSGQVNFGLMTFGPRAFTKTGTPAATCPDTITSVTGCTVASLYPGATDPSCGAGTGVTRQSGNILVPIQQDDYWDPPGTQSASNVSNLLNWVDNGCSDCKELILAGSTPINGALRDAYRYLSSGWTNPVTSVTYDSPLTGAATERPCRSVNVILLTDGGETCDTTGETDPNGVSVANAAKQLLDGFTVGGTLWKVKTYDIQFGSAAINTTNAAVATNGGTGTAVAALNEAELSSALANIISSAIKPEVCDNTDNNCNGCTDEGFAHYANVQPVATDCCAAPNDTARNACLASYTASITPANPTGNLALLPCTTLVQQTDPLHWLCYDPGEKCDNVDNNAANGVDENVTKCGSPAHCPTTEVCNGQDDNCDGNVDEGAVCGTCVPSGNEVCDGIDNDCNTLVDDGVPPVACGFANPPNCAGTSSCSNGSYTVCNNNPQTEVCDGLDNDCDGQIDDNVPSVACVPVGTPGNLVYGGTSTCKKGVTVCSGGTTTCIGFVGPSAEICDGIDNDCDGQVDDGVPGVNQACGINQAPCTPGTTACVNGAIVCTGGTQPQPEVCDGIDNDCDGQKDEAPLADAPAAGANGCWNLPGNCCTFDSLTWCPPAGASCDDVGSLTQPCSTGTLQCGSAGTPQAGWICVGGKAPDPEACDGVDNDCNGSVDDGVLPGVGQTCGSSVGVCTPGSYACDNGVLTCTGGTQPSPELCDGLDNDCDGSIDDGLGNLGGTCAATYDTTEYPGDRSGGECKPGHLECIVGGGTQCVNAKGPSPEICDGLDNDCDGSIDEAGVAPNGLNGTADPLDATKIIGEPCGTDVGACTKGTWQCVQGGVQCIGGLKPQTEVCDCVDNDCDGEVDEDDTGPNGSINVCGEGSSRACVKNGNSCQCVAKCDPGEFPCPSGQTCEDPVQSGTNATLTDYCVGADPCANCAAQTVTIGGNTQCGPVGTTNTSGQIVPLCTCKADGCHDPCFGVVCDTGLACTNFGPNAGTCAANNCLNVPCPTGTACNNGTCVDSPCEPNPCAATEVCKPNADFTDHTCVGSCAGVTCDTGKVCKDGTCIDTGCGSPCPTGKTCDGTTCVDDLCVNITCPGAFQHCNPLNGQCENDLCAGVVCPATQVCEGGECVTGAAGTGGTGGTGGSAGTAGSAGTGGTGATAGSAGTGGSAGTAGTAGTAGSSSGSAGSAAPEKGQFGMATGGGGCSVEHNTSETGTLAWLAGLVGLGWWKRRRSSRANEGGSR